MGDPMRIRASESGGVVEVKLLMKHEMESGQRKDPAGKIIPAWHINRVTASVSGREVLNAQFGPAVSKDPFLSFRFKGAARGDRIVIRWEDNHGDSRTDEAVIS